jgi:group I intron endonuclease
MGYIYKITNQISKKCYIGETLKTNPYLRWNEHKRKIEQGIGCPALQDAVKKYGIENFTFEILIICFDEDRYKFEIEYIKKYNSIAPNGYNLTKGGEGGGFYGKKHSQETIERIRKTSKQKYIDNPDLRKKLSERQKIIMSNHDYRNKFKETINNSVIFKNLKKEKGKAGFARIKVIQYDLNNNYINTHNSISDAAKANNIERNSISKNINGKTKTACGFIWKKIVEE